MTKQCIDKLAEKALNSADFYYGLDGQIIFKLGFKAGHASRDEEVKKLRTKITELEISLKQAKQLMDADSAKIKKLADRVTQQQKTLNEHKDWFEAKSDLVRKLESQLAVTVEALQAIYDLEMHPAQALDVIAKIKESK